MALILQTPLPADTNISLPEAYLKVRSITVIKDAHQAMIHFDVFTCAKSRTENRAPVITAELQAEYDPMYEKDIFEFAYGKLKETYGGVDA